LPLRPLIAERASIDAHRYDAAGTTTRQPRESARLSAR